MYLNVRRFSFIFAFITTVAFIPVLSHADMPAVGLSTVTLQEATDVASAVEKISSQLKSEGFSIPLTGNHSAVATGAGLALAPNQVIFARPPRLVELSLLSQSATVGIDLPLKFHVFEQDGEIKLSVNTLGYLIDRHNMTTRDIAQWLTSKAVRQFGSASPEDRGLVTVDSKRPVAETVEAIKAAILTNPNARIPLVINYGESAYSKTIAPVLIVFGNALVGTPLMQADPRIGIDLPLKILVWQDKSGVKITYNDPHFLAGRIDLQGVDARLDAIAAALKNIATAGAGG